MPSLAYYLRPEDLPAGRWQYLASLGFTHLVIPPAFDLFPNDDPTDATLRAELTRLRDLAGSLTLWLSLPTTRHLYDPQDNRRTLYAWDDAAGWAGYLARLRRLSPLIREFGVPTVLLDSEHYPRDGSTRQDPDWAWPAGDVRLIRQRAREWALALRSGHPGLELGQHVIHGMEQGLPAYLPWWKAVFRHAPGGWTLYMDAGLPAAVRQWECRAAPFFWPKRSYFESGHRAADGTFPATTAAQRRATVRLLRRRFQGAELVWMFANGEFFAQYPQWADDAARLIREAVFGE